MIDVIKINDVQIKEIKYFIVDKNNCSIIPAESLTNDKKNEIIDKIKTEYNFNKIDFLSVMNEKQEILFLWPEILARLKNKYSYVNGWLERAILKFKEKELIIETESNMAYKKLNDENVKLFLEKQISNLISKKINIKVINGDFLEDIPETNIKDYQNRVNNNIQQDNSTSKVKNSKNKTGESNTIFGKNIKEEANFTLAEIDSEIDNLIVEGHVFEVEEINTRRGNTFYVVDITDNSNSITVKIFPNKKNKMNGGIKEGQYIKVKGYVQYDKYAKGLTMIADSVSELEFTEKNDNASRKRVELHLHTQMSAMDSVVDLNKAVKRAADWGHEAIAITDHGVVQAFPDAYKAGKKHGVKILYGMEAYMVDDGEPIIINENRENLGNVSFTVFDFETTGLKNRKDEIIEIGAVKVENDEIIDEYGTFVKPDKAIPAKITELTGISNKMIAEAPKLEVIIDDFLEFIGDSVLTAHNAVFDYGFLKMALKKTNKKMISNPVLDTLNLSRALLPDLKNHKLNTLTKHLNIGLDNHHRAVDDAKATAEMLIKLIKLMKDRQVISLNKINTLSKDMDWKELPPYHLLIFAKNKEGLKDLYRLVSSSHTNHFYRKPRVLKSELTHIRDNLLLGSACEAGQLYRAIIDNKNNREIFNIAKFYDFLEIQPLGNNKFLLGNQLDSLEDLKKINKRIYNLGRKLRKPVVATGDVHFLDPRDKVYRKILQAGQGYDDYENQAPLYFRTTEEMLEEFSYLGKEKAEEVVIENPAKITNMIEEMKPMPDGLFTPEIEGADEQVRQMAFTRAHDLYGDKIPEIVEKRLQKELNSIISNGYSVIYLISHKLVKKSLEDGYLVGSRGSVGSSLAATMCEITEVNPLPPHYRCPQCKNSEFIDDDSIGVGIDLPDKKCPECGHEYIKDGFDIPFEVFLGFEGDKVPDIDLNFSGEYQGEIHRHTEELFGRDYVFRAGTISTIASRTAFGFVKGYLDDNNKTARNSEIKRLVKGCTGVRRTTGQHPGGLMVVPRHLDVHDFTPIQHPANDQDTDVRTTHFDYHSISGRILKLDLLGHDDPTSIRMLQDLTGVAPSEIPLDDPETMSLFSSTEALGVKPDEIGTTIGTLGIPEFGTSFVQQMLIDTKPTKFAELVRISGLSHGTDVWLNNAQDLIKNDTARLSEVISVRDDIMNYLIQNGLEPGKSFWIMEHVRKGKGLTEEEEKYMKDNNIPDWYIDSCKKIKYMFPKAHAAAYVMMAYRIAYFKVHYPQAFYATYFTTKASDFDAFLIGKGYEHILNKKSELEAKGSDMTAKEKGTLTIIQIALEAMARDINFIQVDLYNSDIKKFKVTEKGLLPPLISLEGLGSSAAQNIAATREDYEFSSIEDLVNKTSISKTVVEIMKKHGTLAGMPEKNQLSLF
ncbi:MAG: PolC-type DNA polymerase III [Halothermotrichaceae bacterium]